MLHLRNINPMVRAVGTMGAVSALVGGITFAQLTSNTVALSPNTLSTGSANLEIGSTSIRRLDSFSSNNTTSDNTTTDTTGTTGNNTTGTVNNESTTTNSTNVEDTSTCQDTTNGTIPGFNLTGKNGLLPGVTSKPLGFCLKNTSRVPLNLTVAIPDDPFSGVTTTGLQPTDITLTIKCTNGGNATGTLDTFVTSTTTVTPKTLGSLAAGGTTDCKATVLLSNTATITGTEVLPSFDIEFTGTTSS